MMVIEYIQNIYIMETNLKEKKRGNITMDIIYSQFFQIDKFINGAWDTTIQIIIAEVSKECS